MLKKITFLIITIGFSIHNNTMSSLAPQQMLFTGDADPTNHLYYFEGISYSTLIPQLLNGLSGLIIASQVRDDRKNEKIITVAVALHTLEQYITNPSLGITALQSLWGDITNKTKIIMQQLPNTTKNQLELSTKND